MTTATCCRHSWISRAMRDHVMDPGCKGDTPEERRSRSGSLETIDDLLSGCDYDTSEVAEYTRQQSADTGNNQGTTTDVAR